MWKERHEKHIWEDCRSWRTEDSWSNMIGTILGEKRKGEVWLRKLEEARERKGKGKKKRKKREKKVRKGKTRVRGMNEKQVREWWSG